MPLQKAQIPMPDLLSAEADGGEEVAGEFEHELRDVALGAATPAHGSIQALHALRQRPLQLRSRGVLPVWCNVSSYMKIIIFCCFPRSIHCFVSRVALVNTH